MRTYYASDKKRREDNKRKQKEAKRMKRLNKTSTNTTAQEGTEPASTTASHENGPSNQDQGR